MCKIRELGLRIARYKTETLWFPKLPRRKEPPSLSVPVGDVYIQVVPEMNYLGLTLDSYWGFEAYHLAPRIEKTVGAMHKLLPNLGAPEKICGGRAVDGFIWCAHRLAGVRRCSIFLHFNDIN